RKHIVLRITSNAIFAYPADGIVDARTHGDSDVVDHVVSAAERAGGEINNGIFGKAGKVGRVTGTRSPDLNHLGRIDIEIEIVADVSSNVGVKSKGLVSTG